MFGAKSSIRADAVKRRQAGGYGTGSLSAPQSIDRFAKISGYKWAKFDGSPTENSLPADVIDDG